VESNFKIRKVTKDDLPRIFELEKEAFEPDHYPLFVLRQLYDISPDLIFVAVNEDNQIKGYCFGAIDYDNKIGWVFALAVNKPAQKKKIGERITIALLTALKNKNVTAIKLTTTPDNSGAIYLYEKLGFKKVTEVTNYYFDNAPRIIMNLDV
jgi:ribosomal protein S18 acetylase RimI-like enzyme